MRPSRTALLCLAKKGVALLVEQEPPQRLTACGRPLDEAEPVLPLPHPAKHRYEQDLEAKDSAPRMSTA